MSRACGSQRFDVSGAAIAGIVIVVEDFAEIKAHALVESASGGILRPAGSFTVEARAAHGP